MTSVKNCVGWRRVLRAGERGWESELLGSLSSARRGWELGLAGSIFYAAYPFPGHLQMLHFSTFDLD